MYPALFGGMSGAFGKLKRTCPTCHRSQIVALDMKNATVRCKSCGAEIPPPKK